MMTSNRLARPLASLALIAGLAAPILRSGAAESAVGQSLEDAGIALNGGFVGEFAANPSGGLRQGALFTGQIAAGADLNLGTIASIPGATLHVLVTDRFGRDLSKDDIGNSIDVQEVYGGGMTARLSEFSWEQSLFSGRVDILAGRVSVVPGNAASSAIGCSFQTNATCPEPKFFARDSGITNPPVATWGGRVKVWATDTVYLQSGAYDVNPIQGLHSQNGTNWTTSNSTGTFVPYEVGYATSLANDDLPRHYKLGGYYDSSLYSDPARTSDGSFAALSNTAYASRRGRSAVYGWADQMVWRPDSDTDRGLTLFAALLAATSDHVTQDYGVEGGLQWKGPFQGRSDDVAGFVVSDQRLSADATENIRLLRAKAGGFGAPSPDEVMFEVNYQYALSPAWTVMPNIQYVMNPDMLNNPSAVRNIPNAFVIGLKVTVDFPKMLGL